MHTLARTSPRSTERRRDGARHAPGAIFVLSALVALAALAPGPLLGQGWIDPGPRPWPGNGIVKLRTAVDVRVVDGVAHVEVEEWFRNRGGVVAEGDYLYPLPGEAVFSGFSLYQGDRELRGETMDADEARRIYEEIVRRRRDPALIERAGHGLIRARVFPIEAGQTRRITLRYTQVLDRDGDALSFRYAGPSRFDGRLPPRGRDGDGRPVTPRPEPAPIDFTLTIDDADRFREPFSPTHGLDVERRDDGRMTVRTESELRSDLAVFLPLTEAGRIGMTVVTHKPVGEDGYVMLTLSPGEAEGRAVPRDVTVALDVSGSMSGTKIEEAKRALRQLLGTLAPEDRFRLIAFNSRVSPYRERWLNAAPDELRAARRWVDGLRAEGGTAIDDALTEAFRTTADADGGDDDDGERLPIVVFLTDGLPSVGERDPERIAERAERRRGRARVFAFGVGYDVNTYLLDRLSAAGRGATEYLEPGEDVERALGTLAAKIRHPVLTDLEIGGAPVDLIDLHPSPLPDLFAGEELVVLGRWTETDEERSGRIRVEGRRAGRSEAFAVRATFPVRATENDYLPRLWASRRIGELVREVRLHGHDEELVDEIRRLALRHGIVTEYTAYLVQEPLMRVARTGGGPGDNALPRPTSTPDASTGAASVRAAESARRQREATVAADVAAMTADAEEELDRAVAGAGVEARTVGGRVFVREDGVWRDASLRDETRVVEVRAFESAYFELLRRLPELIAPASSFAGEVVVVAGEGVAIRLADDTGEERLADDEIERVVRAFRGP